MKIGYRTIKTAIGASLSIFIAQWLDLQFYASAGIITILCIKVTKKESLHDSLTRFVACLLGLAFGSLCFFLFGYTPIVISLIFILFLPILVKLNIQDGFITSAVIILHVYMEQQISLSFFYNELQLICIGIGIALILNLSYMPSLEKKIMNDQRAIERNFSYILKEMVYFLRYGESNWDGKEMLETENLLNEAIKSAVKNEENRLLRGSDSFYYYFEMRQKQFEILETMLPLVSSLPKHVIQGEQIAIFLEKLSNHIHSGNTAQFFIEQLNELRKQFKEQPLPQDRQEFETRATLFQLINELERYLFIKHQFKPKGRE